MGDVYKTSEPFVFENESIHNNWMDIEFDGGNSCSSMSLFKEFDGVQEVEEPSIAIKTGETMWNPIGGGHHKLPLFSRQLFGQRHGESSEPDRRVGRILRLSNRRR